MEKPIKCKKIHNFTVILALCLFSVCNTSCGKEDIVEILSDSASDTTMEENLSIVNLYDAEKDEIEEGETTDELTKNLNCLRDGDTESLVGMSFGDEFDYDKYVIRGWSGGGYLIYGLKGSDYDSMCFLFNGKGNGFSGLTQFSGVFLGIDIDKDRVEKISDVLGPYKLENDRAIWDFETTTLSATLEDEMIRFIQYSAKGDIADVPEKPEEKTDFGRDRRETKGRVETVYNWSACGSESEGSYAVCDPRDVEYDENTVSEFIRDYLLAQGIHKEKPDRVTYNQNGEPLVECYVDQDKGEYCIILHVWGHWLVDFDTGTRRYLDALYCTTHRLGEEDIYGYMIYEEDAEQNRVRERLYDRNRKEMAEVTYEYVPGTPFPFVLESWNLNEFHPKLLIRNQKTWFFKDVAVFDEEGKFIAYEGGIDEGDYLPYSCRTVYDEDGRLKAVQEELQEEDIERNWGWWDESIDYSGKIEWLYRDDGTISHVEYGRSSYGHGTFDSSGDIEYDSRGRMLCNDYYITHGSDSDIYLYEEDSDMPWCMIRWCCYAPGFEEVYLFLPEGQWIYPDRRCLP